SEPSKARSISRSRNSPISSRNRLPYRRPRSRGPPAITIASPNGFTGRSADRAGAGGPHAGALRPAMLRRRASRRVRIRGLLGGSPCERRSDRTSVGQSDRDATGSSKPPPRLAVGLPPADRFPSHRAPLRRDLPPVVLRPPPATILPAA